MSRITLADLTAETTTFDLFGGSYQVRTMSRSVQKKYDAAQQTLVDYEGDDGDKAFALLADAIDALLEPLEGAQPMKKALVDAWKRDEVHLGQARALYERTQEAALARPT